MAYLKPQTPLKDLNSGDYFYPLTTIDQIITGTSRLSAFLSEDSSNHNLLNLSNIGNITGNIILNGTLTVSGNTILNGNLISNNGIFSNYLTIGSSTLNTSYNLYVNGTSYFNGQVTATQFNGPLNGNATSATKLVYGPILNSDAAINSFHAANTFQTALWNNTSSPGTSNGIILDMGWTSAAYGAQLAIDDDPSYLIALRQRDSNGWKAWKRIPMGDGTGASGTWGISITGGAKYLNSYGNTSQESGRTSARGGVYTYNMYDETANGAPSRYLSVIGFGLGSQGHVEIAGYWCSNTGLWYRSLRDCCDNWYAWNRIWVAGNSVTSAVWNDYAEYREADTIQGGRCVREVGDDTLTLTTKRLMRGCSITSDTWGFAQGETDKAKTPIAVAGRVLAYPLEDRELFKEYIGYSVCSGPDGTVSLMTEEEELKYPWAIVGTVSAVPDYEEWGGGEMADRPSVKVDGRIWIKVK